MTIRNRELMVLLESHGLQVSEYNNWILINNDLPAIRVSCQPTGNDTQKPTYKILVHVLLSEERIIQECFAGIGDSEEESFKNGMMTFCLTSLHVMLAALWNKFDEEQVMKETWEFNGNKWTAFIGNFSKRVFENSDIEIPANLMGVIERESKVRFDQDLNWVSTFYGNVKFEYQVCEFLINNEKNGKAEDAIKEINWPPKDSVYMVRHFLILKIIA
jgi:hypothetical protein